MSIHKHLTHFILLFFIVAILGVYAYERYLVLRPLENQFAEGKSEIEKLVKAQKDRTDLLDQISHYRDGLYALNLILESRKNVISGTDPENPFLVFPYNQVLDDLRRLLPKDSRAPKFQVNDKGLMTLPIESVDYASLGRVLKSVKKSELFSEVKIPTGVQRTLIQEQDAYGRKQMRYVYTVVLQAILDPAFWQNPLPFEDVTRYDYFSQAIRDLYISGAVEGYENHLFKPNQPINLAEFYKITLYVLFSNGNISIDEYNDAINSPEALWYDKYVALAKKEGLLSEEEGHVFYPDLTISRLEALRTILRIFEVEIAEPETAPEEEEEKESVKKEENKPVSQLFIDIGQKSEMYPLVQKAWDLGMLPKEGFSRLFNAKQPATRAEVAYWVWRLKFDYLNTEAKTEKLQN